jgi:hypothetical protein
MHVSETVVHHISEEDDCVWTFALRDAPRLAQIRIDEDSGHGPEERTALRERPLVENLWIGDEEDVSRRLSIISLLMTMSTNPRAVSRARVGGRGEKNGVRVYVPLLDLAIDTVHPQGRRYRFRAIRRLQSRLFSRPSAKTWADTWAYRGVSKPDSARGRPIRALRV